MKTNANQTIVSLNDSQADLKTKMDQFETQYKLYADEEKQVNALIWYDGHGIVPIEKGTIPLQPLKNAMTSVLHNGLKVTNLEAWACSLSRKQFINTFVGFSCCRKPSDKNSKELNKEGAENKVQVIENIPSYTAIFGSKS